MPINSIQARQAYDQLWKAEDTVGTTLLTMVLDSYGQEIFDLDPEAFRKELEEGFRVADIPTVNTDKLWALWNSLTTDLVHTDVSTFINSCNVLNGTPMSYDVFDAADPYECAWAITELSSLDPTTIERLSPEVRAYISNICTELGLYRLPTVLAKASNLDVTEYAANMESHATTPEEMQLMVQGQLEYQNNVEEYVSRRLNKMMVELHNCPLMNRDQKSWNSFIGRFSKVLK